MARFIIALGSSHELGQKYLAEAVKKIHENKLVMVCGGAKIYKNSSSLTGYNCLFYNSALAIKSRMHPFLLYRELYALEHYLGRIRTYQNSRRTIDLDMLISLDFCYNSNVFFLPHKQAFKRIFFVIPMIEALKSAGWHVPIEVLKARSQGGQAIMQQV